jgi:Fe-S-cluster containining protein
VTAPLTFRCTGCGACCRALRVAITAVDLIRLTRATGRPPDELVAWLQPDAVDMSGEPQSFVELREGRRLMVLAQEHEACVLLDRDNRCSAYAARPRDCRTFPFDFDRTPDAASSRSDQEPLRLLPMLGCEHDNDASHDLLELKAEDTQRWDELASYQNLVARWNRGVFHRRRLGRSAGGTREFLAFALRESDVSR